MSSGSKIFYDLYKMIYETEEMEIKKKSALLRDLFRGESWAWKIVGLSKGAYKILKKNDFKKVTGELERHHYIAFTKTAKEMLKKDLLTEDDWWKLLDKNEKVHLISRKEHIEGAEYEYYPLPEGDDLFRNDFTNWSYGPRGKEFLKNLKISRDDWKKGTIRHR